MNTLIRLTLAIALLVPLYYILPLFLAEIYYSDTARHPDKGQEYQKVLIWNPQHKQALSRLAVIKLNEQELDLAKSYSLSALRENPTDGQAMAALLSAYSQQNNPEKAQEALQLATRLWPSHAYVRSLAADHYGRIRDENGVLKEWDILLTRHASLGEKLFPVLFTYAGSTTPEQPLLAYLDSPWWPDFFVFMAENRAATEILEFFYTESKKVNQKVSQKERGTYITRLIREQRWKQAYALWLDYIPEKEQDYVGYVFDGGFESRLDTKRNTFGWNFHSGKHVRVRRGMTNGVKGRKALHAVFRKDKPVTRPIASQRLLLKPGSYNLSFRSRTDNLKTEVGLDWRLICTKDKNRILAKSEPLKGRNSWQQHLFSFQIPEQNCSTQILYLDSAGEYYHEDLFQGALWIDEVRIEPLQQTTGKL